MSFLAVVLALLAERAFPQGTALGESRLISALLKGLRGLGAAADHLLLPWLVLLAGVALTQGLVVLIDGGLAGMLFGGVVLFLCLGPRDLADDVQRLLLARQRGDAAEAERLSRALQGGPAPEENHRGLIGALFIQSHERLFGVLLWFMALGPAGAVGYRLASRLPRLLEQEGFGEPARQAAEQLHALGAWLTSRISAALFALAGSMDDALAAWKQTGEMHYSGPWSRHGWAVLAEVASGALAMEDESGAMSVAPNLESALREVLRMQTRALLVLMAIFALYTSGTLV